MERAHRDGRRRGSLQQFRVHGLQRLIRRGGSIQCLFLYPDGSAIRLCEQGEDYVAGTLSELGTTRLEDAIVTMGDYSLGGAG
jgi:hypothetical protein